MTLSIIIPVYNVEDYLSECLESVLNCNLTDCEIILVLRDGQDRSGEICTTYQRRYDYIRIEKQCGSGLSNARNTAMHYARGDYVLFIDSDDYVNSKLLDGLIDGLRRGELSADVIVTDYYFVEHPAQKLVPVFQIGAETPPQRGMEFLPVMLRKRKCFWNVWRYLYRREFLLEHSITFLENKLCEDVDYTTRVLLSEPDVLFIHCPFYFYNVGRGGSLMDHREFRHLRDTVEILSDSIEKTRACTNKYADLICARYQFEYILNIALIVEIDEADRESAISLYEHYEQVLSPTEDWMVSLFRIVVEMLGIKKCAWLLHGIKQIYRMLLGRKSIRGEKK